MADKKTKYLQVPKKPVGRPIGEFGKSLQESYGRTLKIFKLFTMFRVMNDQQAKNEGREPSKYQNESFERRVLKAKARRTGVEEDLSAPVRNTTLENMQNFFRENTDWSETDIKSLQYYEDMMDEGQGVDFLVKSGFAKRVDPRWKPIMLDRDIQILFRGDSTTYPNKGAKRIPDGVKTRSEQSAMHEKWLPPTDVTYKKVGNQYYRLTHRIEYTDKMPTSEQLGSNFESWMDIVSEDNLPDQPILPPEEVLPTEQIAPPEKDTRSPRQASIKAAQERRDARALKKGYVEKPAAPRLPSLKSTASPIPTSQRRATAQEAAGAQALPRAGGGKRPDMYNPRKPPKKNMRMGGFVSHA